jgi:N6-L-threonylcarbamoyladenine synthase
VDLPMPRFTHPDRNEAPPDFERPAVPAAFAHLTEFSFSGLKTAAARHLQKRGVTVAAGPVVPSDSGPLSRAELADFCASFQRVVVETLLSKTFAAARWLGARSVGIAGGVSANSRLRRDALERADREGLPVFVPALALSTDNAAMIAAAGLRRLERGLVSPLDFNAHATLAIE